MSRRESRSSLGGRHNDALYEFEAFKKKFLLANKHITKLNSTLSVRIEELNAQIHALNVENLRLRTSEIHLTSELKREREKSRKVMTDAEAASQSLTRHLNFLRQSLDIPHDVPSPPSPPSPKARQRPAESNVIPELRIAREPNVPGIDEEEEPISVAPKRKSKSQHRLSASNLPLPTNRVASHPEVVHMDLTVALTSKRKLARRPSGLLASVNTETTVDAEQEEVQEVVEVEAPAPPPKDRKRRREGDDTAIVTVEAVPFKPKSRVALQRIDNTVHDPPEDPPAKEFLAAPSDRGTSTTPEPEVVNGRERRARKSVVSYAEPSLKVKMRKPDSAAGSKKRSSNAPKQRSESPVEETERRSSLDNPPEPTATQDSVGLRRKTSRPQVYYIDDDDNSDGAEADEEYIPDGAKKGWGNVNLEGRKKLGRKAVGSSSGDEVRRHSMAV